jgi:small-conductance mechanosensitive channel
MRANDWAVRLESEFLGNAVAAWLQALATTLLALLVLLLLKRLLIQRFARAAQLLRVPRDLDPFVVDLARHSRLLLLVLPSIYLGSLALDLPPGVHGALRSAAIVAVLLQVAIWSSVAIEFWVERQRRRRLEIDAASATLFGSLNLILKLILWVVIVLVALDNFGVNVTALVAGFGVGGIAVALALQHIFGDVIAALSIAVDKPFVIGDTIQVDDYIGTVEAVGLKTTRLRSISGEQIVFSNADLLKSRIRNYKSMQERRVVLSFGLNPSTPVERFEKVPAMARRIVESQEQVRFDRAHFKGFGKGTLDFEVVYYVQTPDYRVYMDRQQAIAVALMHELANEGIELANPSRILVSEPPVASRQPPSEQGPAASASGQGPALSDNRAAAEGAEQPARR